ncbi:MAG: sigma-70 family RNA polymerase sigma factor, partial [Actinomycetota bacterium]
AVMNEARARHRGTRRQDAAVVRIGPAPSVRDAAEVASTELTDVVMSLPHQQRAAVYLVYWCDHTTAEAAEAMGCEPATVRRYLHLARKKLKRFADE